MAKAGNKLSGSGGNGTAFVDRALHQSGALCWRFGLGDQLEVLLITSRETRRWVVPKGWPMKGLTSRHCAAREAFEEAGVEGDLRRRKVGNYGYEKRLKSGQIQPVEVALYALEIDREYDYWPERGQRERLWTSQADAASRVDEPELKVLIAGFVPRPRVRTAV